MSTKRELQSLARANKARISVVRSMYSWAEANGHGGADFVEMLRLYPALEARLMAAMVHAAHVVLALRTSGHVYGCNDRWYVSSKPMGGGVETEAKDYIGSAAQRG